MTGGTAPVRSECPRCGKNTALRIVGIPGISVHVLHGPRNSPCEGSGEPSQGPQKLWVKIGTWPAGYYAVRGSESGRQLEIGERCVLIVDGRALQVLIDGKKTIHGQTLLLAQQW